MRELRKKMFLTLFGLLSALACCLTLLMLTIDYTDTTERIRSDLLYLDDTMEKLYEVYTNPLAEGSLQEDWMKERTVLTELPSYSIYFSHSPVTPDQMLILYHNSDQEAANRISTMAMRIIKTSKPGTMNSANVLSSRYAWYYGSSTSLTIVDISSLRYSYFMTIGIACLVLLLFESVLYFVCRRMIGWMIQPIEKAFERQKQFVADASHELKTPLAVILSSAEAMERDHDDKWLHNIETEATRMSGLVTDLLDLTRSEQSHLTLERVDFSNAAETQCAIQEAVIFEKNILLEEDIQPDIEVMAVRSQLIQVAAILIDNAISHSDGKIRVSLVRSGNRAVFSVANTGEPIAPEEREKIFERFYRSDNARTRSSNRYGLGLAIAKNIVQNFKGTIGVDCAGGWTVFRVSLPALPPFQSGILKS